MFIQNPRFAIIEMNSQNDIYQNLVTIERGVQLALQQHASFIVLPENAFCFGEQKKASNYFDVLKNWCSQLAHHYQIFFLAGTLPCPYRPDGGIVPNDKLRQTSLLFDPSGDCIARYDKIHLFKAIVNDSTGFYDEGRTFEAGTQPIIAKTPFGNIGMMVCFDLRFSTLALYLRQLGADILTVPSAFTYQTGKAHWQSLLIARALDSQCLVIGAGQTGTHFFQKNHIIQQRQTWGHSAFVNANGEIINHDNHSSSKLGTISTNLHSILSNIPVPIAEKARSWLNESTNISQKNIQEKYHTNYRLIFTDFNQSQQHQWRCNIALLDCQRFNLSL